jgi:hypothetical protein
MKFLRIFFLIFLLTCVSLPFCFSAEGTTDAAHAAPDGPQYEKIIIAIGLFAAISVAFLNWESRSKKKKKK